MNLNKFLLINLFSKLKSESLFLIATFFAIITSFIIFPKFSYIDTHVLMILFNLMVVVELYKKENIFQKIDWILLATFISFFIFVGNLSNIELIRSWMFNLLSEFTTKWHPLLLGVNIGDLGTLIASLASLILYKLYISEFPEEKRKFFILFSILNFSILILMGSLFTFFI